MNDTTLTNYLKDYLGWNLTSYEINTDVLAENIADELERQGYCSDPYLNFENALACPINKRREKYCGCTNCINHKFCMMLRKEGYV